MRSASVLSAAVLALGIGTGAGMFALLNAAILERLPYPQPERLVQVWATDRQQETLEVGVSFEEYRRIADRARTLEDVAYYSSWFPTLTANGRNVQVKVARSSANLFRVLSVSPSIGRSFTDRRLPYVVLSHELTARLFGETDRVPESPVVLDGTPYTPVGVMPRGFSFPSEAEAWISASFRPKSSTPVRDGFIVGRLAPGAEIAGLNAELQTIAQTIGQIEPDWTSARGLRAVPLQRQVSARVRNIVLLLFASVVVFFLIACVTAAQILFVENLGRRTDFAVRAALGARPRTLRAELFGEAALVAALATPAGGLLSVLLVQVSTSLVPSSVPELSGVTISQPVLAFMLVLGAAAALGVAVLSGWRLTTGDIATAIHGGATPGALKPTATRSALACLGTAGLVLLTFSAVALILEMWKVTHADLGFEPRGVYASKMCSPEESNDSTPSALRLAFDRVHESLPPVPGVRAVAIADGLPVGSYTTAETLIEGVAGYPKVRVQAVSSDYFRVLGIPIVEGRGFVPELGTGEKVAVVNEAFARQFWPGASPLGQQFKGAWDEALEPITVVGVARNVRRSALDVPASPEVYIPFFQQAEACGTLLVATDRGGSAGLVRDRLWDVRGRFSLSDVGALESRIRDQNWRPKLRAVVLGLFAALALTFGAVALYATLRQVVSARKRELATRAALGATPGAMARLVLRTQVAPVGLGIILGALASVFTFRVLGTSFYGMEKVDWTALPVVCAVLALTALLASVGPILRSGRADVMVALREE